MAKIEYDPYAAYERLSEALNKVDARAAEIFAYHAALEIEVDVILAGLLPHPEKVRSLGFANKVRVLEAAWIGEDDAGERVGKALSLFNDVRNAVAHHDTARLEGTLKALRQAYSAIDPSAGENASIAEIAQGICAFFGDGPTPSEMAEVADQLSKIMEGLSRAFRPLKVAIPTNPVPKIVVPATFVPKLNFPLGRSVPMAGDGDD